MIIDPKNPPERFGRLQEVHDACRLVGVSWSVRYEEADGTWYFAIRSQAPSENWDTPKGRSFTTAINEVLEYLGTLIGSVPR